MTFNLNAVAEEIMQIDVSSMEEMLIHSTERIQRRLEALINKEQLNSVTGETSPVSSATNAGIGAMHRLIFREIKINMGEEESIVNSQQFITYMVENVRWLLNQFKPLEASRQHQKPSNVYLKLFDARKADTQTLSPSRIVFRDKKTEQHNQQHTIAMIGTGAETTAIGTVSLRIGDTVYQAQSIYKCGYPQSPNKSERAAHCHQWAMVVFESPGSSKQSNGCR